MITTSRLYSPGTGTLQFKLKHEMLVCFKRSVSVKSDIGCGTELSQILSSLNHQ